VTIFAQTEGGSVKSLEQVPLGMRLGNAAVAYVSYLRKTVWPDRLAVFYPHPYDGLSPGQVGGAVLVLAAVSVLVFWAGRRWPYLAVGWLWYLGTLVPVIGLVQVGAQGLADRYTYVPLIGVFLMLCWGVPDLLATWHYPRPALAVLGIMLLVGCLVRTWSQLASWHDSVALWQSALRTTGPNAFALFNLGDALENRGQADAALQQYARALRIDPGYAQAHQNLGALLARQGPTQEAVHHLTAALRLEPRLPKAHNNLGAVLGMQGKLDDAMRHFAEALRLDPEDAEAHHNLGLALEMTGKTEEAFHHFALALRSNPDDPVLHYDFGVILRKHGKLPEALACFRRAASLRPDVARYREALREGPELGGK
jgi:tetratricopeptide (TPR) repeat protein